MAEHLLALEALIIERLSAALAGHQGGAGIPVLSHGALPEVGSGAQRAPVVVVLYAGAEVLEARPDGRAVRLAQEWVVLLVTRELGEDPEGASAAGPLADTVLQALMGWQPSGTAKALRLSALPAPEYANGNQWFPLSFSVELVRRIEPGT